MTNISAQDHRVQQLDSLLTPLAEADQFSGVVLLAEGEEIIYQRAFGLANRESGDTLTTNSVFELASVSKQFTAAGIIQLREQGKLKLTDKAALYLPQLKAYPEVTISQLIHHTGGLPDYMGLMDEFNKPGKFATNNDVLKLFSEESPKADFNPGEQHRYSNTGYLILASIIEKVSGVSFGDYLEQEFFKPLGMTRTSVYQRRYLPRKIEDYAFGYIRTLDGFSLPDTEEDYSMVVFLDGIYGDGMVNSTVGDLYLWDRALVNHTIFSEEVTQELFSPGQTNDGESTDYAFGWSTGELPGVGKILQHGGGWPGYATMFERHLDTDKVIIVLRNDDGAEVTNMDPYRNIRRILYNLDPIALAVTPEVMEVTKDGIANLLGVYAVTPDFKIEVLWKEGHLFAQATGQQAFPIFKSGENEFFLKAVEAQLLFHPNEAGEIDRLVLLQGGQEIPAVKE